MNAKILHERALEISKKYLRAESDLISILQAIDDTRAYRDLGYRSLYEYATQAIGLSESVTYNLITVARKSREVPQLQEMLAKQEMTLSNARTIAPLLTAENQEKWISAAATLSKRELEKEIARENPKLAVVEQCKYVADDRVELKVGISERLHEKLKQIQDIQGSSLEEALEAMADLFLEKNDPVKKAQRNAKPVPGQVPNGRYVPAAIRNAVILRDGNRCTHVTNGKRCNELRWTEIHHIRPYSDGGTHDVSNLTTLCRGHHQMLHEKLG